MKILFFDTNADFLFGYENLIHIPRIGEKIFKNNTIYIIKDILHDYYNKSINIVIDKK